MIYGWRIVVTVQAGFRQNMDVQCVSYDSNTVGECEERKTCTCYDFMGHIFYGCYS